MIRNITKNGKDLKDQVIDLKAIYELIRRKNGDIRTNQKGQ